MILEFVHKKVIRKLGLGYAIDWPTIWKLLEQLGMAALPEIKALLTKAGLPGWLIAVIMAALTAILQH
jgi:hypothetical protein